MLLAGEQMEMRSEYVQLSVSDGTTMRAWTARPKEEGKHAGLLVLQEAFGVNAHIRDVAGRSAIGYCMGGRAAFLAALTVPLASVVSYYGGRNRAECDECRFAGARERSSGADAFLLRWARPAHHTGTRASGDSCAADGRQEFCERGDFERRPWILLRCARQLQPGSGGAGVAAYADVSAIPRQVENCYKRPGEKSRIENVHSASG